MTCVVARLATFLKPNLGRQTCLYYCNPRIVAVTVDLPAHDILAVGFALTSGN